MEAHSDDILPTLSSSGEGQNDELRAILFLLQSKVERLKEEVDNSYDLYNKVGVLTDLSKEIKTLIGNNPIQNMIVVSNIVDDQVKLLINSFVTSYFQYKKEKLLSAYRTKTSGNKLHYSVVLKEDSTDNRLELLEFFDRYFSFEIEEKYPVTFQFVPENLLTKINTLEKLV